MAKAFTTIGEDKDNNISINDSQRLIIFSHSFPYGNQDQFLRTELPIISSLVPEILIIPLVGMGGDKHGLPENVKVLPPVFSQRSFVTIFIKFLKALLNPFFLSQFLKFIFDYKKLKQLFIVSTFRNFLIRNKFDTHNQDIWYFYWGVNLANYLAFFKAPGKAIVRFHNYDLYEELGDVRFRKELLSNVDKAVCISTHGANYLKRLYPEFSSKLTVSKLGTLDFGRNPEQRSDKFVLVSCSNVIPTKRVELIAEVVSLLNVQVTWYHFGDGPLFENLKAFEKKSPKHIEIKLLGRRKNSEVFDFYRQNHVDLFLNMSLSEGIPVSIMEAISFGIPVVATNITGNVEIVDEKVGGLVSVTDEPVKIASFIQNILQDPSYSDMRSAARSRWEESYAARTNFEKFKNLLSEL